SHHRAIRDREEVRLDEEQGWDLGSPFRLLPCELRLLQVAPSSEAECFHCLAASPTSRREDEVLAQHDGGNFPFADNGVRPEALPRLRIESLHDVARLAADLCLAIRRHPDVGYAVRDPRKPAFPFPPLLSGLRVEREHVGP